MQMSSNKGFCSFALDSADEKFNVWTKPYGLNKTDANLDPKKESNIVLNF